MHNPITLDQMKENLDFFHKMYDTVRLVDPVQKKVIDYRGSSVSKTEEICYHYWKTGKICENCISVRAYRENKSFMKLEQQQDSILVATAIPVMNIEHPIVLELLKDATESMMIGAGDYNIGKPMHQIVSEMNDMVTRDYLTSLYNRRFIDERLPVDIVNATLNRTPLSVLFLDLDGFKSLNDAYGHEAGDNALKAAGAVIQKSIRTGGDWAARYGGDEFFVCLSRTGSAQANVIARRIQDDIGKYVLSLQDRKVHFSVSIGIATMDEKPLTAEELIRLADSEMYAAKKHKQYSDYQ